MISKRYYKRIFEALKPMRIRWDLTDDQFRSIVGAAQRSFNTIEECEACVSWYLDRATEPPRARDMKLWREGRLERQHEIGRQLAGVR